MWLCLVTKISHGKGTDNCAGFLVKLKKQFPLFWNMFSCVFWQKLEALVAQGAAQKSLWSRSNSLLKDRCDFKKANFAYISNLEKKLKCLV